MLYRCLELESQGYLLQQKKGNKVWTTNVDLCLRKQDNRCIYKQSDQQLRQEKRQRGSPRVSS